MQQLLAELRGLLDNFDSAAAEVAEELVALASRGGYSSAGAELIRHIDGFDFDAALEVLDELERQL